MPGPRTNPTSRPTPCPSSTEQAKRTTSDPDSRTFVLLAPRNDEFSNGPNLHPRHESPALSLSLLAQVLTAALCCSLPAKPPPPPLRPAGSFQAGAGVVDVTPQQFPVIVNGGMTSRTVDKVKTPLNARGLALSDGETTAVLVVGDSCMMPPSLDRRGQEDCGRPNRNSRRPHHDLGHPHALRGILHGRAGDPTRSLASARPPSPVRPDLAYAGWLTSDRV